MTYPAVSICGSRIRAIVRSFILLLVAIAVTPAGGRPAIAQLSNTAKESSGCPSTEFTAFFRAFSARADLHRKYTHLPLEYGVVDMDGTAEEPGAVYRTKMIGKFEELPQYRPKSGAIFPSASELKAGRLRVAITTSKGPRPAKDHDPEDVVTDSDNATATLFLPETGFRVHYRFRRAAGCWFLFGISDRST